MSARRITYVLSFDVDESTPPEHIADILAAAYAQIDDARSQDDDRIETSNIREHMLSDADVYSLGSILDVVGDGVPDEILERLDAFVSAASPQS